MPNHQVSLSTYTPEYQATPSPCKPSQWTALWAVPVGAVFVVLGMGLGHAAAPMLLATTPAVFQRTLPKPMLASGQATLPRPQSPVSAAVPEFSARHLAPASRSHTSSSSPNLAGVDVGVAMPLSLLWAVGIVTGLFGLARSIKGQTESWAMAATGPAKPLLSEADVDVAEEDQQNSNHSLAETDAARISAAAVSQLMEEGELQVDVAVGSSALATEVESPGVMSIALSALLILAVFGSGLAVACGTQVAMQGVLGVIALYIIMSINEYVVHRYYQHLGWNTSGVFMFLKPMIPTLPRLKSSGHVEHHRETLDDMSLDTRSHHILDVDPYRGTAFSWSISAIMTLEIALQSYPILWLLGWSWTWSTVGLVAGVGFHAAVWQALHPAMHGLPDPPLAYGMPGWLLARFRESPYFRFLYVNHVGHHRVPGAHANYNVCYPLADHLFGTYAGVIPPKA